MVALMFDEIMMVTGALAMLTHGRLQGDLHLDTSCTFV